MTDLLEIVLIALACPLVLPTIIEAESEEEDSGKTTINHKCNNL